MALERERVPGWLDDNGQKRRLAQLSPFIKEMKLALSLSLCVPGAAVKTETAKEIVRFRSCRRRDTIQTASSVVVMSASHSESFYLLFAPISRERQRRRRRQSFKPVEEKDRLESKGNFFFMEKNDCPQANENSK